MKQCSKCKRNKLLSEYYIKDGLSGRLHAQCKQCYKEHRKTFYQSHYEKYGDQYRARARERMARIKLLRQDQLFEYLSDKSCEHCGINDMRVLDFDHIDHKTKRFNIARGVNECYSWEQILIEIKKCRILCSNCHRIRTAEQFGWRKLARWPSS